ncbi:MAG: hypothetical protein V4735_09670 [Pseudomonadota bacterium]
MNHVITNHEVATLAGQCREAMTDVTFHDLATRQLFEALITRAGNDAVSQTAQALGEQKIL